LTTHPAILVHLFAGAPGCEGFASNAPEVWRWFDAKPLSTVLRIVLNKLQRAPGLIELADMGSYVNVTGDHPLCPDYEHIALAAFCDGASFEALSEAREDLIQGGWKPAPPTPPQPERTAA
jgi:hypothetical protein